MFLDEVSDDFGVGLGREFVAFSDELFLEREIVFDDAVMDDDDFASAVAVGMGVFFGGAAVRSPASVANAGRWYRPGIVQRISRPAPLPATAIPAES